MLVSHFCPNHRLCFSKPSSSGGGKGHAVVANWNVEGERRQKENGFVVAFGGGMPALWLLAMTATATLTNMTRHFLLAAAGWAKLAKGTQGLTDTALPEGPRRI